VTIAAIIGMALATWLTRVGGLFLMKGVTVKGRLKAALDALPPAVLMAVIAPTVLATGTAETLAAAKPWPPRSPPWPPCCACQ